MYEKGIGLATNTWVLGDICNFSGPGYGAERGRWRGEILNLTQFAELIVLFGRMKLFRSCCMVHEQPYLNHGVLEITSWGGSGL